MSIFSSIVSKLFGHSTAHAAETPAATTASPVAAPPTTQSAAASSAAPSQAAPSTGPAATAAAGGGDAVKGVDVTAILDKLVADHHEKLDWRHSIVDMLKALDMDSSLSARKELAAELHYTGSTADTATMNMWLIKQVIAKLAANGGKLPAELLH